MNLPLSLCFRGSRTEFDRANQKTFKSCTRNFWDWYAKNAERFNELIASKDSDRLPKLVNEKIEEFLPGFGWCFGPGANGSGHSFTLTGEGNPHKQLLARYWKSQAPALPGWTFHSAKQPSADCGAHSIHIGSHAFDPIELWLTPYVNRETEAIDLTVWHPLFASLEQKLIWTVIYLYLDEALGEMETQNWIGEIKVGDQRLAAAMPLRELPAFVKATQEETGWNKGEPGAVWTAYRGTNPEPGRLRRDIIAGSTLMFPLIRELEDGRLDPDPFDGHGAQYMYVAFDQSFLPESKPSAARGEFENALDAAMKADAAGMCLGGATGTKHGYIDLMLVDGANSVNIVRRILREKGFPKGTTIEHFAKSRQTERSLLH